MSPGSWVIVDGRHVYVAGCPAVILTAEEADRFAYDDGLQAECRAAARAAGLRGTVPCHTIGGAVVGTVDPEEA